jgi:nucleoside-diphosphate-sugar epimerase
VGTTLVTGASGLIGSALAAALAAERDVVGLSRRRPREGVPWLPGDFTQFEDLRRLDRYEIDAAVHLGAVTGGCSERDGIAVNVAGTRTLLRYLLDRGCRRLVLASSIAAVGFADPAFRPLAVPIPDDHPCLARDAYGLSKHLMEDLAAYFARLQPEADILCLRLSSVAPDGQLPPARGAHPLGPWSLGGITLMACSDAVLLLRRALELPPRPGFRLRNAAPRRAWVRVPTAEVLEGWYGAGVDLSALRQPGQPYASAFDVRALEEDLGLVIERAPDLSA